MRVRVYVKPEPTRKGELECRQCIMTEKVLAQKGVEYERIILDDESTKKFVELGHMSAPVVLVGDGELVRDGWAGFQPLKINELVASLA